jgi:sugar phosphate isomerase/epimerase
MRFGLDAYSLRWQDWNAFQMLEYCAQLGLENVQFSERAFLASFDDGYLRALRRRADELGISLEIGILSFDRYSGLFTPEHGTAEQQLSDMIRAARILGSRLVRCVLGNQADRLGPIPYEKHVEEGLRVLRAVSSLARDLEITLAVENHGGVDFLARELKAFVEEAGTDYVGVCLDTGNPAAAGEDPVLAADVLAPYVVTTHVRDSRVWAVPDGAMVEWVPVGQGDVDLSRILAILSERAPDAPINFEIITGVPGYPRLIPYLNLESNFWRMYPDMLAWDFARFIRLAQGGKPEPLRQITLPPGARVPPAGELGEQLRAQQRRHLEESVAYAKTALRIREAGQTRRNERQSA